MRFTLLVAAAWALVACGPTEVIDRPSPSAPVASDRPNVGLGETCGGDRGAGCIDDTAFCQYALVDHCGASDAEGVCTARPTACTREFAPVCGCDGRTYSNACEAAAAGVSVALDTGCDARDI